MGRGLRRHVIDAAQLAGINLVSAILTGSGHESALYAPFARTNRNVFFAGSTRSRQRANNGGACRRCRTRSRRRATPGSRVTFTSSVGSWRTRRRFWSRISARTWSRSCCTCTPPSLLHHECSLDVREHYTDTAGAIDHVFGLCHLLGFRFAPRIRDLADRRLYVADNRTAYTALNPMIGGTVDFHDIGENWDETLRLAASIKAGTVAPSALMRRLAAYPKQNGLAKTLREVGRLERSLFTLDWISDPALRRRANAGLNKGEARSRWLFSIARAPRKDWLSVRKRACVHVRGRPRKLWRRVRTLRPDDRSGPGLASVRGRDRPAPETRGSKHVHQTQRHAACAAERCVAAR